MIEALNNAATLNAPPADNPTPIVTDAKLERDKRIGREISFGIQQTLACWATDFIDPYVSKWYQNKYGNKAHEVTAAHTWGGEIVGDSAAFFAYMFAKRVFTAPIDAVTAGVKSVFNPMLTKMGKRSLKTWAYHEHIDESNPEYQKKLEAYKAFQAENIVDSSIIATAATGLNVGAQKYMFHNKQGMGLILASKLIGAAATMGTMLGLRTALPTTIKSLDDELSERYFSKLIRGTKKLFGVEYADAATTTASADVKKETPLSTLPPDKMRSMIAMVAGHAQNLNQLDKAARDMFFKDELRVIDAMIEVFNPNGKFADTMAQEHQAIVSKLYQKSHDENPAMSEDFAANQVSLESVQSILRNRQQDLQVFKGELLKPEVMQQIMLFTEHPELKNPDEASKAAKKEYLVQTLLQQKNLERGEPAVHIYANAKGQILEHQALAHIFEPEGKLTQEFTAALREKLPDIEPKFIEGVAKNYMADRKAAAVKATKSFALDGDVVKEAVARSKALQDKFKPRDVAEARAV